MKTINTANLGIINLCLAPIGLGHGPHVLGTGSWPYLSTQFLIWGG